MEELRINFIGRGEVKGFLFTQLKSSGKAYLYHVRNKSIEHFEVFKRRENLRFGNVSYPTSEAFGIWAWTYRSLNEAERKYNKLNRGGKSDGQKK